MIRSSLVAMVVAGIVLASGGYAAAGAAPVGKVVLKPPASQPAEATVAPVTFGMVFRDGDIPRGKAIEVSAGGQPVAAQVDVKRHFDDGSVRFAIVSLLQPVLQKATGDLTLEFAAIDPKPAELEKVLDPAKKLLATDFDAVVTFKFPDGKSASASARKMLEAAGDKVEKWLSGPITNEFLLMGPPVGADGKADPDLNVQFQVRAYAGSKAVRVSVVVENCWDTWAGNIGYDVTVALGKNGKVMLDKRDVDHGLLSRWRKVFWWPAPPIEITVAHDPDSLFATKALPNFDVSIKVPEKALAGASARWAPCRDELFGAGFLATYMGQTGGREEIAYYPAWTVRYLLSQDPRAKEVVLGHGDLVGSWPIHVRNSKTKRLLSLDERPKFWFGANTPDKPIWKPDRKPLVGKGLNLQPENAHVGSFAYVPFLVTGDYYYLEEAWFWGNWSMLSMWQVPRQEGKGIMRGQIRGDAWTLRNIADAGFIAPDGTPEAKYFEEKIHNNMAYLTAQMYGPPERNALGFWGEATHTDHMNEMKDAPKPWMLNAPWMVDYLIWSLSHLAELGYADAARPRDFLFRWRVGLFTHPDVFDPKMGTTYRMIVGEMGPDKKVIYYDDWKKLAEENAKVFDKMSNFSDYYYGARGALACAVDAGYPKADEALKALDAVVWNGKPLGEGRAAWMTNSPNWCIAPRAKAETGK